MQPPLLPGHTLSVTPEKNQLRVTITRDSDSQVVFNNLVRDAGVLNQINSGGTPVTGTFWQTTQPVSFTWVGLTNAQLRETPVPVSSSALVSDTPSSVPSSNTSQTLIAANASRKSLTIFNNSTAILYVCFSETATQAGAKVPLGAGGFYEMPAGQIYTGIVSGIWASVNGNASIYEGV